MTAWTSNIKGIAGEAKYPIPNEEVFQEPKRPDLYTKLVDKTAQANGIISIIYVPKSVTIAASDTLTLTVKGA
jgi:hypothetical protein